jgi:hypothetical protein
VQESGKTLVREARIATTDVRNEQGRLEPVREHPFTGPTNDVAQAIRYTMR